MPTRLTSVRAARRLARAADVCAFVRKAWALQITCIPPLRFFSQYPVRDRAGCSEIRVMRGDADEWRSVVESRLLWGMEGSHKAMSTILTGTRRDHEARASQDGGPS